MKFGTIIYDINNDIQYGTDCRFYSFKVEMKMVRLTRNVIVSAASLFLLAGGAAYPFECGTGACCCMTEITDNQAFHQGHCGCGCGQFEQSQVPDQSAVTIAVLDSKPVQTKYDYIIETDNGIFENANYRFSEREKPSHSPPLILDNKYTPLLC